MTPTWTVGPSIALELDIVLSLLMAPKTEHPVELPEDIGMALQRIPKEWLEQAAELVGPLRRDVSLLHPLALLTGMLHEGDYSRATLAMRSLTLPEALDRAVSLLGVEPDPALPEVERLADLMGRYAIAAVGALGLDDIAAPLSGVVRREIPHVVRLLQGGDLHTRFWHWLDRGFYEFYQPWRSTRTDLMREQETRALSALGAPHGQATPPLGWLAPQNALRMHPALEEQVLANDVAVHFWVQPFGFYDHWYLDRPGAIMVAFAEPGALFAGFRNEAEDVALRAAALADPTRLMILRIIRYFALDNTQIAGYLNLSRPTVSVHAKLLREAGLIDTTPEGRQVRHRIQPAEVRRLFDDLIRFLDLP